jgi:hypothetical protein
MKLPLCAGSGEGSDHLILEKSQLGEMRHKVTEGKRVTFECDKIFHTCTRSEIHGDEIEELGGDTCIDPLNDSKIVLHPPWIARL